jgi:N6-L-threonylcarbamoyladenine synthase
MSSKEEALWVLGIESSCDETGVGLYEARSGRLVHLLHSQVALHAEYGGVVPELASRDHIRRLPGLVQAALEKAELQPTALDCVAYTAGPGLAGALLVGAGFAQAYAMGLGIAALPIHHLEGHLLSPLLADTPPRFPFVALLVSGGHTQLLEVRGVGDYRLLGETIDDAAGEAFDKTAKLLDLPYPGGPELAALAEQGEAGRFTLPRPMLHSGDLDFSFSGLKTAVLKHTQTPDWKKEYRADLAAAFQEAAVEILVKKAVSALTQTGLSTLVVAGGVGANRRLRTVLNREMAQRKKAVFYPEPALCTDNGAMIAFAGALRRLAGEGGQTGGEVAIRPRWPLDELLPPCP